MYYLVGKNIRLKSTLSKGRGLENILSIRWGLKGELKKTRLENALSRRWRLEIALERKEIWLKNVLSGIRGLKSAPENR